MNKQMRIEFLYEEINHLIELEEVRNELGMNTQGVKERMEKHFRELRILTNK